MIKLVVFIFVSLVLFQKPVLAGNPDFLWQVISEDCVPNQKAGKSPDPCAEVSFTKDGQSGYAVFKDYNGPLQYLLLPTTKITGIEDPSVLAANSLNYFYQAWEAKSHLEKMYGASIAPEELSLTVNSKSGRSQNQLHIHISCTRSDVKDLIQQNLDKVTADWSKFPGGILEHDYYSRRISANQLQDQNAFQLLANDLPEAAANMQEFGLAVVAVKSTEGATDFVLLANRVNTEKAETGHVEEIQDHKCTQLYKPLNF